MKTGSPFLLLLCISFFSAGWLSGCTAAGSINQSSDKGFSSIRTASAGTPSALPQSGVKKPEANRPTLPIALTRTSGAGQFPTLVTISPNRTAIPSGLHTQAAGITQPARPLLSLTPRITQKINSVISDYDAAKMLGAFAAQYLGLTVQVVKTGGITGEVQLPQVAKAAMLLTLNLAGQTAAGTLTTSAPLNGVGQVMVGEGDISGDLNADISSASAGAYGFLVHTTPPTTAEKSLELIRKTYPAVAKTDFSPRNSNSSGFIFQARTTHTGPDWKTKQVTAITTQILAGTTRQGTETLVWIVVANGNYTLMIQ